MKKIAILTVIACMSLLAVSCKDQKKAAPAEEESCECTCDESCEKCCEGESCCQAAEEAEEVVNND